MIKEIACGVIFAAGAYLAFRPDNWLTKQLLVDEYSGRTIEKLHGHDAAVRATRRFGLAMMAIAVFAYYFAKWGPE